MPGGDEDSLLAEQHTVEVRGSVDDKKGSSAARHHFLGEEHGDPTSICNHCHYSRLVGFGSLVCGVLGLVGSSTSLPFPASIVIAACILSSGVSLMLTWNYAVAKSLAESAKQLQGQASAIKASLRKEREEVERSKVRCPLHKMMRSAAMQLEPLPHVALTHVGCWELIPHTMRCATIGMGRGVGETRNRAER